MNMIPITTADDPQIEAFRGLRDRTLRGEEIFIAEGTLLVERLLRSRFTTDALLVIPELLAHIESIIASLPADSGGDPAAPGTFPVYVAPNALLREIAGFPFHRGAMAIGCRRPDPTFDELLHRTGALLTINTDSSALSRQRWIIVPEVTKPENLGHVFRSAAAFGLNGVLLGPRCGDPLSRRSLRVSMGGTLFQPYARSRLINHAPAPQGGSADALLTDLRRLRSEFGFELWAAVLAPDAVPLDHLTSPATTLPNRLGILIGNEFDGLDASTIATCDRKVTIPMAPDTDSLNLGVATGIFCYATSR